MRLHDLVPPSSETLSQCTAWTSVCLLTLPRFIVGRSWNFYGLKRNFPPLCMFLVLSSTVLPIAETWQTTNTMESISSLSSSISSIVKFFSHSTKHWIFHKQHVHRIYSIVFEWKIINWFLRDEVLVCMYMRVCMSLCIWHSFHKLALQLFQQPA